MASIAPISDRGDEPTSDVVATGMAVRADVVRLVRERKYEDALALLYAARADSPDSREISASIRQIKEFLIGSYAKRLGGLDRVASPVRAPGARFPDALLVARYIDGSSTFEDISRSCPLGQLRTLQVLVALYAGAESVPPLRDTPQPPAVASVAPPAPDAWRSSVAAVASPSSYAPPAPDAWRSSFASAAVASPSSFTPPPSTARSTSAAPPAPWSGWSAPATPPAPPVEEPAPETQRARTGDSARPAPVGRGASPESPDDVRFKQAFARGTAAFVQRRFEDAVEAFRECEQIRPTDAAAATMLRRALRDTGRG